ncbi:MAG: WD40 repeat domain-containing protein [Chloroflexota bacterium]
MVDAALREVLSQTGYNTVLNGHEGFVVYAEIDPNGRFLASVENNGTVILWDLAADSSAFRRLNAADVSAKRVRFSPDGQTMAVLRRDEQIVLWDVSGLADDDQRPPSQLATLAAADVNITKIQYTTDGRYLIGFTTTGPVLRWDVNAPETAVETLYSNSDTDLVNLAVSGDGRYLATYLRGTILIRDLSSPSRAITRSANSGNGVELTHGIFSPDDTFLVTTDANGSVAMWDMTASGSFPAVRFANTFSPPISDVDISYDGSTIAIIVQEDLSICLLSVDDPDAEIVTLKGHNSGINAISFSPSGKMLASASDDRSIRLWELGGTDIAPEILRGHGTDVVQASFGENGRFLTTLTQSLDDPSIPRNLFEWDLSQSPPTLRQTALLPASEYADPPFGITNLIPAALNGNRQLLATSNFSGTVNIWSYAAGDGELAPQNSFTTDGTAVTALAFSPDGQQVAAATTFSLYVWNLAQEEPMLLSGFNGRLPLLVFSEDGRYLAAANSSDSLLLYVWDLQGDPNAPQVFDSGHESWIGALAFSPDGRLLASAGYDDLDINVWNLDDTSKPAKTFSGHADWVLSLAFSPDGHFLASGSWDRTIRLWQMDTEEKNSSSSILKGHERQVRQVVFSPDGGTLASVSQDETARLWIVGIEKFAVIGCEQVRRNLSLDEWERYLRGTAETYALTCDNRPIHPSFIKRATDLVRAGDTAGAEALLELALQIDSTLDIDPAATIQDIVDREQARSLIEDALTAADEGDIETAVANINQALALNVNARIDEEQWNAICWYGSTWGYAADVLFACENAVALDSSNGFLLDSRGLARALTGDIEGAIADFTAYVQFLRDVGLYTEGGDGREAWIEALQAGENPFTEDVLAELRQE